MKIYVDKVFNFEELKLDIQNTIDDIQMNEMISGFKALYRYQKYNINAKDWENKITDE